MSSRTSNSGGAGEGAPRSPDQELAESLLSLHRRICGFRGGSAHVTIEDDSVICVLEGFGLTEDGRLCAREGAVNGTVAESDVALCSIEVVLRDAVQRVLGHRVGPLSVTLSSPAGLIEIYRRRMDP